MRRRADPRAFGAKTRILARAFPQRFPARSVAPYFVVASHAQAGEVQVNDESGRQRRAESAIEDLVGGGGSPAASGSSENTADGAANRSFVSAT